MVCPRDYVRNSFLGCWKTRMVDMASHMKPKAGDMSEYDKLAFQRLQEQIDDSSVFLSIVTDNYLADPICWAQIGYAVLADKPIYLLCKTGTVIPENLRRLAYGIEEFSSSEDIKIVGPRLIDQIKEHP